MFRSARARNAFVRILGEVRAKYGFAVYGYVVMPEHIYPLMGQPVERANCGIRLARRARTGKELGSSRERG